jgi:hypothetical protein
MNDWNKVIIGSISTLRKGISYKSEEYCTEEFGNPFITIKCFVKGGGYEPSGLKYLDGVFTKADELIAGDILFSATDLTRAGDIVGSPLRVPNFGKDCIAIASTDCMKIEFNVKIVAKLEPIENQISCLKVQLDKLIKQKSGLMHDLLTGTIQVNIDSAEAVSD